MRRKEIDEDKVPAETTYIWLGQTEELDGELGLGARGKGQGKGGAAGGKEKMPNPEASEGNGRD